MNIDDLEEEFDMPYCQMQRIISREVL